MSIRRRALDALIDITDNGAYANLRLKALPRDMQERDIAWINAAVYTTLEHLLYIDHVLKHFTNGKINRVIRGILRLGICQLLYMDVPQSAVCNESVKLAKETGKGALSSFVNGVMRSICRSFDDLPPLPTEIRDRLSIQYSYPHYIVDEYLHFYGAEFTETMLSSCNLRGMTIRAQYPYSTHELAQNLDQRKIKYARGSVVPDAFKLENGIDVTAETLFIEGKITVQSEGAMLASMALGIQPGMHVLDACAAPGGKSAYISHLMCGDGSIVAWELHEHRAELMDKTLHRLNVLNVQTQVRDASVFDPEYERCFDAVLVDAPCSGLGITGKPDARYSKSAAIIINLAQIQSAILDTCARYVRPGGVLVYSTCTVSNQENEAQAEAFLHGHTQFKPGSMADIVHESQRKRAESGTMQLFPHLDGTEGFFIAKFRREV
ncbi:MAG: 16S rRNA (cytosine(967)-C(5))-methyltransferase RsmB [Clostridia bacterium]